MKQITKATIAGIVLMTGMAFAQTNFNTTPQTRTTCKPVFSAFDAASGAQTVATSINGRGEITGWYYQEPEEFQIHGFVRAVDGTITTFNVPGSPTFPLGISSSGKIMGFYFSEKISHGFLRAPNGTFTLFDAPGAYETDPTSMNSGGEITGLADGFGDFLRAPDGTFTTFDIEGTSPFPTGINSRGDIIGQYSNPNGLLDGFLRSADGTVTIFAVPGALATLPQGINSRGEIIGSYGPDASGNTRGFVRSPDGTITTFAPSGAVGTEPLSINSRGETTGWYVTSSETNAPAHGFILSPGGGFAQQCRPAQKVGCLPKKSGGLI